MNWTKEQEAILNEIENGDSHLIINAGAGCAKTTTIVEGAKLIGDKKAAFMCFNKSIATELSEKLPDGVEASTFHAFGLKAFREAGMKFKINNYKVKNIISDIMGDDYFSFPLVKLIGLIKGSLLADDDVRGIRKLIDRHNIELENEEVALESIPYILEGCRNETYVIDFDDMIWLPIQLDLNIPKYEVLFVDEAQDFNECQRELIDRACNGGRCIIVGDRNQAIYGFRGADSDSIRRFQDRLSAKTRDTKVLTLSTSFRCPTSVVAEANRYVKEFYAMDGASEGKVTTHATFDPNDGDLVLCRYNAPLISAFYSLIGQGKSAYILGRDMSKGLTSMVNRITKDRKMSAIGFAEKLDTFVEGEIARLERQEKLNQIQTLEDKVECLSIFVAKADTVQQIHDEIKKVFDVSRGKIKLSTVHKAKGLEADNVYILATNRMPHPKGGAEENNICYVAITRAKKNLYYCGDKPSKV